MIWRLIRYLLIVACAGALIYILHYFAVNRSLGPGLGEISVAAILVLNIVYLLFGRAEVGEPTRVLRLVHLWLDAKETEFRRRAGK